MTVPSGDTVVSPLISNATSASAVGGTSGGAGRVTGTIVASPDLKPLPVYWGT